MVDFPYLSAGFEEDEWYDIPRTDKLIIRDFYLMDGNKDRMVNFGFYESDRSVRGAMKMYALPLRPVLQLSLV